MKAWIILCIEQTGFISFKTSIQDQDAIAIAFKRGGAFETFGEFIAATQDTFIVLKLVKPSNLQPQFTDAWKLRLKEISILPEAEILKRKVLISE